MYDLKLQIRALVIKAEAKAVKTYAKKLHAENARHEKRKEELLAECELAVKVARAALPEAPPLQTDELPHEPEGCDDNIITKFGEARDELAAKGVNLRASDWLADTSDPLPHVDSAEAEELPPAVREPFKPKHMKAGR